MAEKELVKKAESEVMIATNDVFSNQGFEGTTAESFMIPMLSVVNALSDVKKRSNARYNADAVDGDFYNSALNELYKELNVRVLSIDHQVVVWKPREAGGGFIGTHHKTDEDSVVVKRDGVKKWDADGNEVIDTIMLTCMDADNPTNLFFFPLAVSSFKYGRSWVSKMKAVKVNPKTFALDAEGQPGVASWAVVWNVKTVMESNDKGEWYTIGNTPVAVRTFEKTDMEIINKALELVSSAKRDYGEMDNTDSSGTKRTAKTEDF